MNNHKSRRVDLADADSAGAALMVTVQHGEVLHVEARDDLGTNNAGLLIFADGREPPEYLAWDEVELISFARSQACPRSDRRKRHAGTPTSTIRPPP